MDYDHFHVFTMLSINYTDNTQNNRIIMMHFLREKDSNWCMVNYEVDFFVLGEGA